jgi:hypothetical protein
MATTKAAGLKPPAANPLPAALPAPLPASDADAAYAEIDRLAAALGSEAFLLPRAAPAAEVISLLERIAARLDAGITLVPRSAPAAVPPSRRFRLTDRDREVIAALVRYRYLRTGQIHRLIFAPRAGLQMTRRRLRFLSAPDFAYLQKAEFFVSNSALKPESAYFLGPNGLALLAELGLPPPDYSTDRRGRVKHRFLEHALELSEFRLKFELALKSHPFLRLHRFVAEFEVKEHMQHATTKERFKLYHLFPGGPKGLFVYPDALFILRYEEAERSAQRLYFAEIDRDTEGTEVIRNKAAAYQLYREQNIQKKFGEFPRFRVLLQAPSAKHAAAVRRALNGCKGEELFWTAAAPDVNPETILTAPVWTDSAGKPRSIFREGREG